MKIERLIEAARKEDWDFVDGEIPKVASDSQVISWAIETGIKDENDNVRDLAVSILEKSEIDPQRFSHAEQVLYHLMRRDKHPYVRYRSAFALASHGSNRNREEVVGVLKEATRDPDTKEIAEGYLETYKK